MHKNIPNLLTIARLLAGIAIPLLLLKGSPLWIAICLAIYIGGSITDILDGHLSRKHNCVSDFGKIVDPIADKILNLGALFSFAFLGVFSVLFVIPIFAREIMVTLSRFSLLKKGKVIAAEKAGKIKTLIQTTLIINSFIFLLVKQLAGNYISPGIILAYLVIVYILLLCSVYQTIYSGYSFYSKNPIALFGHKTSSRIKKGK